MGNTAIRTLVLPRAFVPPKGAQPAKLGVSLAIVPVLEPTSGETTLGQFAPFDRWSELAFTLAFEVDPLGPDFREGYNVTRLAPEKPELDLWREVLPAGTPLVRPPTPTDLSSYDVRSLEAGVEKLYASAAASTVGALERAAPTPPDKQIVTRQLERLAVQRFQDFHPEAKICPDRPAPKPRRYAVEEVLSFLGLYPRVLRALGLVVDADLALKPDQLGRLIAEGGGRLRGFARFTGRGPSQPVRAHYTRFSFDQIAGAWSVAAAPGADSEHVQGFLALGRPAYGTQVVDLVGAVQQLVGLRERTEIAKPETPAELPRLRSAGISVFREGRKDLVEKRMKRGQADLAKKPHEVELFADDVVRGYAVDVQPAGKEWMPLCARLGTYLVDGRPALPEREEEGFVTLGATGADGGLRVHEVLFTWDGWSLSAPHPAKVDEEKARAACEPARAAASGLKLETRFRVKDCTLPRLRYGQKYRLRARAVDLAGNALSLPQADARFAFVEREAATGWITYRRYQTPHPPAFYADDDAPATGQDPEGRDVDELVLREGEDEAIYWLAPPAVPCRAWIDHGIFDVDCAEPFCRDRDAEVARAAGEPRWSKVFAARKLPFFNDPAVDRILLRGLPTPSGYLHVKLQRAPGGRAIRVTLLPGKPRAEWDGFYELRIWLPRGYDGKLVASPCIAPGNVEDFGLWEWIASQPRVAKKDVEDGLNGTLCPPRELRLVHAVKRPREGLTLVVPEIAREPRLLPATVRASFDKLDTEVVGAIDLAASWRDWEDVPPLAPRELARDVHVARVPVGAKLEAKHVLDDTRARQVTYTPTALSKFAGLFKDTKARYATPGVPAPPTWIPSSAPPPPPQVAMIVPTFRWQDDGEVHQRHGHSLRVYLERPWFSSGAGEMLAVVIGHPEDATLRDDVTRWGSDPLYEEARPARAALPIFLGQKSFRGSPPLITDVELHGKPGEPARRVALLPFGIDANYHYNGGRQLWYRDLEIDFGEGDQPVLYQPFVRLALARYQPHALHGAGYDFRLSPIVVADVVQLQPGRTAVLVREKNQLRSLTVDGALPRGAKELFQAEVLVQEHAADDRDVGWVTTDTKPMTLVDGKWTLSGYTIPGCGERRLVVRELQLMPGPDGESLERRAVYFDIFSL